jgi:hypothetical protein
MTLTYVSRVHIPHFAAVKYFNDLSSRLCRQTNSNSVPISQKNMFHIESTHLTLAARDNDRRAAKDLRLLLDGAAFLARGAAKMPGSLSAWPSSGLPSSQQPICSISWQVPCAVCRPPPVPPWPHPGEDRNLLHFLCASASPCPCRPCNETLNDAARAIRVRLFFSPLQIRFTFFSYALPVHSLSRICWASLPLESYSQCHPSWFAIDVNHYCVLVPVAI